jgi:alkylhydroperoxidase family enzyme
MATVEVPVHPVLGVEWLPPVLPAYEPKNPHLERAKQATGGHVPRLLPYVSGIDWVAKAFADTFYIRYSYADARTLSLVGLLASHENSCRYCYGTRRALLRIQGMSIATIEQLESDLAHAEASADTRAVLEFVRTLARSNPRPPRKEAAALEGLGMRPEAVAEIAAECSNWCFGNRLATFVAAPIEQELEALPDSFVGRLLRPILRRKMSFAKHMAPPPAEIAPVDMPFGPVLEPIRRSHLGFFFADTLRAAFASPVLPQRAKALVFGVVARSLACQGCEGEARRLLEGGGLAIAVVDEALDNLASPALDPLEAKVVTYARDTVRFRPGDVQRSTRALADAIGPLPALEAAAVASLANGIVRLAMLQS